MKLSSFKLAWYTMNIWNSEKNHPPSNGDPSTPWSPGGKPAPAMNGLDSKHTVDGCDVKKITSW